MNKVIKNKRGLELVTGHSSGYKTSSEKFLYSLYIIWPSLMMWCKAVFLVIPKITSANLCKSIHDIINYFTSICPFESGKCGKERKKLEKFEYLVNEKYFLHEIKNIFHSFRGTIIWRKNKNLIKNSGHKF